jgi:hypothetical protein
MGAVQGNVRRWLQAEGLCVLAAAVLVYARMGYGWGVFALFFMAPDLSMVAYSRGPKFGAAVYNAAHSYIGPFLLGLAAVLHDASLQQPLLIWLAHIGFCRATRFGLKYPDNFDDTHLGQAPFNLPAFLKGIIGGKTPTA